MAVADDAGAAAMTELGEWVSITAAVLDDWSGSSGMAVGASVSYCPEAWLVDIELI